MSSSSSSKEASRNPHTITRFILQEQQKYPNAKGDLTIILNSVTLAVKIISAAAKGAGIFQRYGVEKLKEERMIKLPQEMKLAKRRSSSLIQQIMIDEEDLQKELQDINEFDELKDNNNDNNKKEDIRKFAYDSIYSSVSWCGKIPLMLSTIDTTKPIIVEQCDDAKYVLVFDPIDGKQNIEINASIGTIFGIYKVKNTDHPSIIDILQKGKDIIAAGYALYGDATVVILSFGDSVNGFTLDPSIGEFVLTHKNIRIPDQGNVYCINEGYTQEWNDAIKNYISLCKKPDKGEAKKLRYTGCMVADVHRVLIRGGIFLYPETKQFPNGKLNLLCECNPLAFIVEAAGGRASNGKQLINNILPKNLKQTTPIFIGSKRDVMAVEIAYKRN